MQIRKITSAGVGALLAGMTLAAPAFADLSDFPAPFVSGGEADFVVVFGADRAAESDVASAEVISTALGGLVEEEGAAVVGEESHLIEATGEALSYGESVFELESSLDDTELETLLTDGAFDETEGNTENDVEYTQRLQFTTGDNSIVYAADTEDDDEPLAAYLKSADGDTVVNYELKFDDAVEFDNATTTTVDEDFEGSHIDILGSRYTIVDADSGTALTDDDVEKLVLLGGAVETTATDEQSVVLELDGVSYTVTPNVLSATEVSFDVAYSGKSESTDGLDEGETEELSNEVDIGVDEIFFSEKETKTSSVRFRLGARKITLETGQEVEVNDEAVDGTLVTITSSAGELTEINVAFTAEDDVFLGEDESWVDPVFGAVQITYSGIEDVEWETLTLDTTGDDDGRLVFSNSAGDELEIPSIGDTGTAGDVYWGDELVTADAISQTGVVQNDTGSTESGNLLFGNKDGLATVNATTEAALEAMADDLLLLVAGSGEARILEITSLDVSDGEYDLRDKTTGRTWEARDLNASEDLGFATLQINNSAVGVLSLDLGDSSETSAGIGAEDVRNFETELGAFVGLENVEDEAVAHFYSSEDDRLGDVNFTYGADDQMELDVNVTLVSLDADNDDDDAGLDRSSWGAIYTLFGEDDDKLEILYPDADDDEGVEHLVYVSSVGGAAGSVATSRTSVDTSVTAASAANLVLVGGPCVNDLVAQLAEDGKYAYTCESFPEGAYLHLVEDAFADGQTALVVAGLRAEDTVRAAAAVRDYETSALTGMEHTA